MLEDNTRNSDIPAPLRTSPVAASVQQMELEAELMLQDIVKLAEEQPISFAASDIGQSSFRFFAYLMPVSEQREVLKLRLRALLDPRVARHLDRPEEVEAVRNDIDSLRDNPPEPYPFLVSAEDAMLHGDAITAQLLAHEFFGGEDSDSAPEALGADLSPYTLDAIEKMRLTPRESQFVDPFETDYRPPVLVEQVQNGEVVASAWMDAREANARS